jgi:hypothetical protein
MPKVGYPTCAVPPLRHIGETAIMAFRKLPKLRPDAG